MYLNLNIKWESSWIIYENELIIYWIINDLILFVYYFCNVK